EIDMSDLAAKAAKTEVIDGESSPPTVRYTLKDGRTIDVLASGYPLNFAGDVNGIDPQKVQLTRSLMMIGLLQAAGKKAAGVRRLDVAQQLELLEHLESVDAITKDKEVMAAIKE